MRTVPLALALLVFAACTGDDDGDGGPVPSHLTMAGSQTACDDPAPPTPDYTGTYTLEWRCAGDLIDGSVEYIDCHPDNNPLLDVAEMQIAAETNGTRAVVIGSVSVAAESRVGSLRLGPGTDGAQERLAGDIYPCTPAIVGVGFIWRRLDDTGDTAWVADAVLQ